MAKKSHLSYLYFLSMLIINLSIASMENEVFRRSLNVENFSKQPLIATEVCKDKINFYLQSSLLKPKGGIKENIICISQLTSSEKLILKDFTDKVPIGIRAIINCYHNPKLISRERNIMLLYGPGEKYKKMEIAKLLAGETDRIIFEINGNDCVNSCISSYSSLLKVINYIKSFGKRCILFINDIDKTTLNFLPPNSGYNPNSLGVRNLVYSLNEELAEKELKDDDSVLIIASASKEFDLDEYFYNKFGLTNIVRVPEQEEPANSIFDRCNVQ